MKFMNHRIWWLALGSFAIGTEAFMISGMLPTLASALHVTTALAGQLVTVFSLVYAFSSPVITTLTGKMERRKLMIGALLLIAIGNALCGLSSSYGAMLAGRVVAALGAGVFGPMAIAVASALTAPEKRGRALSIVIAGNTISLIAGVPFGTWIALTIHWRATFWFVAGLAMLAAVAIRLLFPEVPSPGSATLRERLSLLKRSEVLVALLTTLVWGAGIFSFFTYVTELFAGYGAAGRAISLVLFFYGIASFIGVRLGGSVADRLGSHRAILIALSALTASLLLLSVLDLWAGRPGILAAAVASLALYGLSGYMFNPAQQHRLIGLSGSSSSLVLSLNASALYLGSALGAFAGGSGRPLRYSRACGLFLGGDDCAGVGHICGEPTARASQSAAGGRQAVTELAACCGPLCTVQVSLTTTFPIFSPLKSPIKAIGA